MRADLHIHTTFSDGLWTPAEIFKKAESTGLNLISITDHDTIAAYAEIEKVKDKFSIKVIHGVEISATIGDTEVHLLAYCFDLYNKNLNYFFEQIKVDRKKRAIEIVRKLQDLDVEITIADVEKVSGNSPICRPHIASALVNKGLVKNFYDAFSKYIHDDGPANQQKIKVSVEYVLDLIHNAGGLVFIAHPYVLEAEAINKIISLGIDGIEVIHPLHKKQDVTKFSNLARRFNLLQSGGSDFHGRNETEIKRFGKYYIGEIKLQEITNTAGKNKFMFDLK